MKKILFASLAASLVFVAQAHAAGTGTLPASGTVTNVQCTWITSNVSATLSAGVVAAYDCNSNANNTIFIGTASQRGTTKNRTIACAVTSSDVGADTTTCNNSTCASTVPSSAGGATCTGNFQATGNTLFTASSDGGSVTAGSVGTTCDADPAQAGACANSVLTAVSAAAAQ
ncbi:MAG TPA: hypothetical protein VFF22_05505 [Pseudomonas sp.]|nr:hypothetical protein [Pseudomonas sp.]